MKLKELNQIIYNDVRKFFHRKKKIGNDCPVYFIADIAANHDGKFRKSNQVN